MSTRKAAIDAPLSQERYMSSPEYAALRGISAVATAARTAMLPDARKHNLIWWIQGKSLAECGLQKFCEEIIKSFPERISDVELVKRGEKCHDVYGRPTGQKSLEEFLIDLCINPRLMIIENPKSGDWTPGDETERETAKNRYRDLDDYSFRVAELPYFKNVIASLFEFQRREQEAIKANFVLTAIGQKVWETLSYALTTRRMVLLDGAEGRGKTEAAKAWCDLNFGLARFVTLRGINNKTTAFREIARALGIAGCNGYKSTELQARIEDVLQRSKLMLVLDEGHFIFNQGNRIYTRPELADWIHTLCNRGIPIALVTTPQFMVCLTRANKHVDWNYRQFRRRVRRYVKLPAKNTPRDIEAVIRKVLPGAPNSAVKQVLSYVHLSKRDLSAVGDVVDEIKALQGRQTLAKVTYEEVTQVIDDYLVPSEKNFIEAITEAEAKLSPKRRKQSRPQAANASEVEEDFSSAGGDEQAADSTINLGAARETSPSRLPALFKTV